MTELKLKVTWPDGKTTDLDHLPVNRKLIVQRGADRPDVQPLSGRKPNVESK